MTTAPRASTPGMIYLYIHVPLECAVEDGSPVAGPLCIQLSSPEEVARLREARCGEAAAPFLDHQLFSSLEPARRLVVPRATLDAALEVLAARRDRIAEVRRVASAACDATAGWGPVVDLARLSEADLRVDHPPADVAAPRDRDETTASALVRWARRVARISRSPWASSHARDLLQAWLDLPSPVRQRMDRGRGYLDWLPADVACEVEATPADSLDDRARRVRDLVARLGTPSQVARHDAGALPPAELGELEDADAFAGVPTPSLAEVWVGERGDLADPRVSSFTPVSLGWSSVGASTDAWTWERAAPLRALAAAGDRVVLVGYRHARGAGGDASAVVVEARSCLGSRRLRQYAWLREYATPVTDPEIRALVRRRGSVAQREAFLLGPLPEPEVRRLEAEDAFADLATPEGAVLDYGVELSVLLASEVPDHPAAAFLRRVAGADHRVSDRIRAAQNLLRVSGPRGSGTSVQLFGEGCLGNRVTRRITWLDDPPDAPVA